MTAEIHRLQEHMQNHPRNMRSKVVLKEKIDKRKKYLKRLRTWDYKRFEWILEKLNLIYKPSPEYVKLYFLFLCTRVFNVLLDVRMRNSGKNYFPHRPEIFYFWHALYAQK